MAFDEVRFPHLIAYGYGGGPAYSTDVIVLSSGHEKRNSNWSSSRAQYEVAHTMKDQAELDTLVAFFRARQGKARGFRFRDWFDYKLELQAIGTGDGVETEFQVVKKYTSSVTETRNITKIVSQADSDSIAASVGGTAVDWEVRVNSVLRTESSDYTVNRNTGIITFAAPVTNTHVITVSGEFDVPVRFDTDRMITRIDNYNSHNWDGVPLVEVRI